MSYDVFLTRREWTFGDEEDGAGRDGGISLAEWLLHAEGDPELLVAIPAGDVRWHPDGDTERWWFDVWDGCIHAKNADAEVIEKMIEMARRLGAKVQGADGELYGPGGGIYDEGPGPVIATPAEAAAFYDRMLAGEPLPTTSWDVFAGRPHALGIKSPTHAPTLPETSVGRLGRWFGRRLPRRD